MREPQTPAELEEALAHALVDLKAATEARRRLPARSPDLVEAVHTPAGPYWAGSAEDWMVRPRPSQRDRARPEGSFQRRVKPSERGSSTGVASAAVERQFGELAEAIRVGAPEVFVRRSATVRTPD